MCFALCSRFERIPKLIRFFYEWWYLHDDPALFMPLLMSICDAPPWTPEGRHINCSFVFLYQEWVNLECQLKLHSQFNEKRTSKVNDYNLLKCSTATYVSSEDIYWGLMFSIFYCYLNICYLFFRKLSSYHVPFHTILQHIIWPFLLCVLYVFCYCMDFDK